MTSNRTSLVGTTKNNLVGDRSIPLRCHKQPCGSLIPLRCHKQPCGSLIPLRCHTWNKLRCRNEMQLASKTGLESHTQEKDNVPQATTHSSLEAFNSSICPSSMVGRSLSSSFKNQQTSLHSNKHKSWLLTSKTTSEISHESQIPRILFHILLKTTHTVSFESTSLSPQLLSHNNHITSFLHHLSLSMRETKFYLILITWLLITHWSKK